MPVLQQGPVQICIRVQGPLLLLAWVIRPHWPSWPGVFFSECGVQLGSVQLRIRSWGQLRRLRPGLLAQRLPA